MKTILTLTAIFTAIISFAQIQSNCNVPSILYTEYDEAVTDLAIRRMYQVNSPDTVYITVPQTQKDSIWDGLAAIFNAPSVTGWDSVFNKYCVKQTWFNLYFNRKAIITLDTNFTWTHNWLNEEIITGYTELDEFISNNEFIYVSKDQFTYNSVTIKPNYSKYMNYKAFADSLLNFDGIMSAYSTQIVLLDGNIITYNKINDTKYFSFIIKYGNCQLGCLNSYKWKYKVNSDCSVDFLGIEETINDSEPFPAPTNCNIASSIKNTDKNNSIISVYPNPVKESLYISLSDNYKKTILIYDIYGREVKQLINNNSKFTIPVGDLQKGVYFVKVGSEATKFIKE